MKTWAWFFGLMLILSAAVFSVGAAEDDPLGSMDLDEVSMNAVLDDLIEKLSGDSAPPAPPKTAAASSQPKTPPAVYEPATVEEPPMADYSAAPAATEAPMADDSAAPAATEAPMADYSAAPAATEAPMADYSAAPAATEAPMADDSAVDSTPANSGWGSSASDMTDYSSSATADKPALRAAAVTQSKASPPPVAEEEPEPAPEEPAPRAQAAAASQTFATIPDANPAAASENFAYPTTNNTPYQDATVPNTYLADDTPPQPVAAATAPEESAVPDYEEGNGESEGADEEPSQVADGETEETAEAEPQTLGEQMPSDSNIADGRERALAVQGRRVRLAGYDEVRSQAVPITGPREAHDLLTTGDYVYLPTPQFRSLVPRSRYFVYGPLAAPLSPKEANLWLACIGKVEIMEVNQHVCMARIIAAYDIIRKGNFIYLQDLP